MSEFVIVNTRELPKEVQENGLEKISIGELSAMHLSAMGEILRGNNSSLNFKLYNATKNYVNIHINKIMEKK